MIEKTYRIGDITFSNRTEYEEGKRDQEKIRGLIARIDIKNPDEAMSLYEKLMAKPYYFESKVGEEFIQQLLHTAIHVKSKKKRYNRKINKSRFIYRLLIVIIAGVFVYSLSHIIYYETASYISQKKMDALVACILEPVEDLVSDETKRLDMIANGLDTETVPEQVASDENEVLYKYSALYKRNTDMIGWIQIPDTVINYPVMQCMEEEEFYLKRDFDKEADINGLPFMDIRCNIENEYVNTLIYGHNMKNGSMFTSLLKYKEIEYYRLHPLLLFDTIYEEGEYEIIAAFLTQVAYQDEETFRYYDYAGELNEQEFEDYIDHIKKLSLYETGITASYGDRLLTLSTCDRSIDDGRFVVVARKQSKQR